MKLNGVCYTYGFLKPSYRSVLVEFRAIVDIIFDLYTCILVGVPPTDAQPFYEMMMNSSCEKISHLQYAVLAMGDSNYPQFCKTGMSLDER